MKSVAVYIAIGFIYLLGILPLPVAQKLGRGFGYFFYLTNNKAARVTRLNLIHCFPEKSEEEITSLTKDSLKSYGTSLLEMAMVWT